MSPPLRALLISYAFPPVGGAAVQRSVKLVKYLAHHGVLPTVLTASNPSVPLTDPSLLEDVPHGTRVLGAPTLEPGYSAKQAVWVSSSSPTKNQSLKGRAIGAVRGFLVPDPQLLWLPGAGVCLSRELVTSTPDVVFITAPPFSQFLLAPLARLRKQVGVVLDYRDEWSTLRSIYEMHRGRISSGVGERLEAHLVRRAHVITTATEEFRENLLQRFSWLDPARVMAIPNGYDPDDFPNELPSPPADVMTVTHAGTIFKLTSARGLLGGLRLLRERDPASLRHLRVRFIGRIVETELAAFRDEESLSIERIAYVPHNQVIHELAKSHVTLCLLDDVPGAERVYPGKIFELMRLPRDVLTLAPPGALASLVARHRVGRVLHPRDEASIAEHLAKMIQAFRSGSPPQPPADRDAGGIARYDRKALAGEFAEAMHSAAEFARGVGH